MKTNKNSPSKLEGVPVGGGSVYVFQDLELRLPRRYAPRNDRQKSVPNKL